MPGNKRVNSDLDVSGKIKLTVVPNGVGNILTYNTGTISQRTYAELISDMGLATTVWSNTTFEPKFTKNTAFNKNFGTTTGTVAQGNDSRIINGQTAYDWGNHATQGYATQSWVSTNYLPKSYNSTAAIAVSYLRGSATAGRFKIRLPYTTSGGRMFAFTIRMYGSYTHTDIAISGYLYGATNQWHIPSAKMIVAHGSNPNIVVDVIFGRDDDGKAYVSIPRRNYDGIAILDVVGAYAPGVYGEGWTITEDDTTPNIGTTINVEGLNRVGQLTNDVGYITNNHTHGNITSTGTLSTSSRAVITDATGLIDVSNTTSTEISYLSGTTSNIQTQLNNKQPAGSYVTTDTNQTITGQKTFNSRTIQKNSRILSGTNESAGNGAVLEQEIYFAFPNGVANQSVDLEFPAGTWYWGNLELVLSSVFSNSNVPGYVKKKYSIGLNNNNSTIYSIHSFTSDSIGPLKNYVNIGEITSKNGKFVIPISNISSTGNPVVIHLKYRSTTILPDNLTFTVSAPYTNNGTFNKIQDVEYDRLVISDRIGLSYSASDKNMYNYFYGNSVFNLKVGEWTSGEVNAFNIQVNNAGSTVNALSITNNTGNVGIGTQSPSEKLHVNGNILTNGLYLNSIPSSWISGKTAQNVLYGGKITTLSYTPVIRINSSSDNVFNLGGLGDRIGFYGYFSTTNTNNTDWSFTVDTNTGIWAFNKDVTAPTFIGNLSGNATTSTTATNANNIAITNDVTTNAEPLVTFVAASSGNQAVKTSSGKLSFNPSLGRLTVSGLVQAGSVVGSNGIAVGNTVGTNGVGIGLYGSGGGGGGSLPSYGLAFQNIAVFGSHGSTTGDWATYFTMSGATNRGWIFKSGITGTTGNVASISATGAATFNSTVTASSFIKQGGTASQFLKADGSVDSTNYTQALSLGTETEGGQSISLSNGGSGTITNYFISSRDGDRNPSTKYPNANSRRVRFDFATAGSVTGATGSYAGVMTYSPWDGTSASTGDSSYQLAFINETGVNGSGIPGLALRKGIDTTWGSWYNIAHSGNVALSYSGNTLTLSIKGTAVATTTINAGNTYTAGSNISISGNQISVVSSPTFSGTVTAQDFIGTSDIRSKENIINYQAKELKTNYKKFNFKDNDETRIGLIAQDVEKVHPEFIRDDKDGNKSISYIDLHSAEIAYLKEENKKLKEELNLIKKHLGL